jgi:hypothetical protein
VKVVFDKKIHTGIEQHSNPSVAIKRLVFNFHDSAYIDLQYVLEAIPKVNVKTGLARTTCLQTQFSQEVFIAGELLHNLSHLIRADGAD